MRDVIDPCSGSTTGALSVTSRSCPDWCADHWSGTVSELHIGARGLLQTTDRQTIVTAAEKYDDNEDEGGVTLIAGGDLFELTYREALHLAFNLLNAANALEIQ